MAIELYPKFQESETYKAYEKENVFKCDSSSISQVIEYIKNNKLNERVLIELPSTVGITHDIINSLSDNIDVRIIGGLTEEYAKSFKRTNMDFLREKSTYSKNELEAIITKIEKIESNIDPSWNSYEKALYLYEYMKSDITYRKPGALDSDGKALDKSGNHERTRTWDTLIGLTNQLSTCNGYAHIYQELCRRQGIECAQVAGTIKRGKEGDHAWNLVTINNQSFIVDIIWDSREFEKGNNEITGFGTVDSKLYTPRCYKENHSNLVQVSADWVKSAGERLSENVPKESMAQERVEAFLRYREIDRQRMMELIEKSKTNSNEQQMYEESLGGRAI